MRVSRNSLEIRVLVTLMGFSADSTFIRAIFALSDGLQLATLSPHLHQIKLIIK